MVVVPVKPTVLLRSATVTNSAVLPAVDSHVLVVGRLERDHVLRLPRRRPRPTAHLALLFDARVAVQALAAVLLAVANPETGHTSKASKRAVRVPYFSPSCLICRAAACIRASDSV